MISLALLVIFLAYLAVILQIIKPQTNSQDTTQLEISIVIAAKNEENNAELLINSLKRLEYDVLKFEVIIVDDNSTDNTYNKMNSLISDYSNFRLFRADNKQYDGKRGALQFGIEKSQYNNIVITDADCTVNKNLLNAYSAKFNNGNDFIFGVAPYRQKSNLVNKIACFDNLWVHILTFSFAKIGLPYSSSARNFGFKKDSFLRIEGYDRTTDTLSGDDDLLLREAVKNKMKIDHFFDQNAFVYTDAKQTLLEHIRQKSRHTSTSAYYLVKHQVLLGIWHLLNFIMLISPIFIFHNPYYLILFTLKISADIFVIKLLMKKFGYKFNIIESFYLQIIYDLLIIVYFLKSISMKERW